MLIDGLLRDIGKCEIFIITGNATLVEKVG